MKRWDGVVGTVLGRLHSQKVSRRVVEGFDDGINTKGESRYRDGPLHYFLDDNQT